MRTLTDSPQHPSSRPGTVRGLNDSAGHRGRWGAVCLSLAVVVPGCIETAPELPTWKVEAVNNPTLNRAMSPSLHTANGAVWLSWLAPGEQLDGASATTWAVESARLDPSENSFVETSTAVRTGSMFANWADFPAVATSPKGDQYIHHLGKLGSETFAYGVFLHGRRVGDATWTDLGLLHDDDTATEHGFVSYTNDGEDLRAFWLDGRLMLGGGPMTLRTSIVPPIAAGTSGALTADDRAPHRGPPSLLLDERVCECCQTDAATTNDGPIVVYRNRSEDEVRDIYIVRFENGEWSEPRPVHDDGWVIAGCPVNGPAIAADGDFVAVAWFTAADDEPRTRIAVSTDGGRSFSRPRDLLGARRGERALGRIDLALHSTPSGDADSALDRTPEQSASTYDLWVAHLGRPDASRTESVTAPTLLVDHLRFEHGRLMRGSTTLVAGTSEQRSSGFPRMAMANGAPLIAWVDGSDSNGIRTARLTAMPSESDR